jgi:UDP-N-acetylglucosamine 4,6-dehydratase
VILQEFFKPTIAKRATFFLFFDAIFSLASFYFAYLLRFNFHIPHIFLTHFFELFVILTALKVTFFWFFSVYSVPWRYFSLRSVVKLLKGHIAAYGVFSLFFLLFYSQGVNVFPRSVIFIDFALSVCLLTLFRVSKRLYLESKSTRENPTIIVGVSDEAEIIARRLSASNDGYYPVLMVDDDSQKIGTHIYGLKVVSFEHLKAQIAAHEITSAVIAKEFEPKRLEEIYEELRSCGVTTIKKVRFFADHTDIEDISIEDLLARQPKDLDKTAIEGFVKGAIVLITGAGGSIGSEIARQCAGYGAKQIILVDNAEYNLYKINDELSGHAVAARLVDVSDAHALERVFAQFSPQIVVHAAAYKHVPLAEENPYECARNNIQGAKNCVDFAIKYQAQKFVLISTDKAVRPTNIMGATKRVCELYVQNIKKAHVHSHTEVAAVRFGNVIGSSGSVIPKFKELLIKGQNLTVTHPDVERYFMLISEACELVLQAGAIAEGGEIFILDMGERVRIIDLANKMIELSGKQGVVGVDIIGLRPGEKLIEELLIDEASAQTKYASIMVAQASEYDINLLASQIDELLGDPQAIVGGLKMIVPEFNHNKN